MKVQFMFFTVSEQGRDDVEDELSAVNIDEDGWDFMYRIVFNELDPDFHQIP